MGFPDAAQHEVVRRCSGIVPNSEFYNVPNSECVTIPGLQRIIALRSMLRSAREMRGFERRGVLAGTKGG